MDQGTECIPAQETSPLKSVHDITSWAEDSAQSGAEVRAMSASNRVLVGGRPSSSLDLFD